MIDLNDLEVIEVLADIFAVPPEREFVLAAARNHCPHCGCGLSDADRAAARGAYAVMRPEYASLDELKALRHG